MISQNHGPDRSDNHLELQRRRGLLAGPCIITIDGPPGVGKTAVARALSQYFRLPYMSGGLYFRGLAVTAMRESIAADDREALIRIAIPMKFEVSRGNGSPQVIVNGNDVSNWCHDRTVTAYAHEVSAHTSVHRIVLSKWKRDARDGCVVEGRAMATEVFPDARHQFFLTASRPVRAARRFRQKHQLGPNEAIPVSMYTELNEVIEILKRRDAHDQVRELGRLSSSASAIPIDTSTLTQMQVTKGIITGIRAKELKLANDTQSGSKRSDNL